MPWTDVWGDGFKMIQRSLKMNAPAGFHSHTLKSKAVESIVASLLIAVAGGQGKWSI